MVVTPTDVIPLYPRRRLVGSASGGSTSIRRGGGADVASSRPYRPGDHFRTIDWKSSARLSSARQSDDFIVRERFAEEIPAVVIVVDRRPEMALYPSDLPWLHKPAAVHAAARVLVASALDQRSLVAYLDYATHPGDTTAGTPFWEAPRAQANVWRAGLRERLEQHLAHPFDAPEDNVTRALGLHPVDGAGVLGPSGRPWLGRRAGDRAGPRLGTELPADRRCGDVTRRRQGVERSGRATRGARSRTAAHLQRGSPRAPATRLCPARARP